MREPFRMDSVCNSLYISLHKIYRCLGRDTCCPRPHEVVARALPGWKGPYCTSNAINLRVNSSQSKAQGRASSGLSNQKDTVQSEI